MRKISVPGTAPERLPAALKLAADLLATLAERMTLCPSSVEIRRRSGRPEEYSLLLYKGDESLPVDDGELLREDEG